MDALTLHEAIAEVCPIVSVSVGDTNDRSTWTYIPAPEATPAQIAAADNVIATIPNTTYTEPSSAEFISRFANSEYRAATAQAYRQTAGQAKNWDVVVFAPTVKMTKKKTQTLKAELIAAGVVTEERADEIFS